MQHVFSADLIHVQCQRNILVEKGGEKERSYACLQNPFDLIQQPSTMDNGRIPWRLLEKSKGIAIVNQSGSSKVSSYSGNVLIVFLFI